MTDLASNGAAGTPVRPMRLGSLLGLALRVTRDHWRLLLLLALLSYGPAFLLGRAMARMVDEEALWETTTAGCSIALAYILLLAPLSQAAITYAVTEIHLGRPISFRQSLRAGLPIYWAMVGTYTAWGCAMLLGLLLLVPGVYLMALSVFLFPVMVIERNFGTTALRRCRSLGRGQFLRVLAVFAVAQGFAVAGSLGGNLPLTTPVRTALEIVLSLLGAIYGPVLEVLFYLETRARMEMKPDGAGEPRALWE